MRKIAQTLTILAGLAMMASACSTLPEDPRTWERGSSKRKSIYVNPFPTKKVPDNNTTTPHIVGGDDDENGTKGEI